MFYNHLLEYKLKFREIPNELNIKAEPVNSEGKVEIKDNENLKDGDKVTIKVTLPADEYIIEREYTLKIVESKTIVSSKTSILISMIILIIVIIVMLILEIKAKKQKKKNILTKIKKLRKKKEKEKEKQKEKQKKKEEEEEIEII